jgi:hypothetical protein
VRLASPNFSQRKEQVSQAFIKTWQAIYTRQRNRNGRNGDQAKPVCWPFSRSRRHGARDQSRPGDGKRCNARPATLIHRACPELARMEQVIRSIVAKKQFMGTVLVARAWRHWKHGVRHWKQGIHSALAPHPVYREQVNYAIRCPFARPTGCAMGWLRRDRRSTGSPAQPFHLGIP